MHTRAHTHVHVRHNTHQSNTPPACHMNHTTHTHTHLYDTHHLTHEPHHPRPYTSADTTHSRHNRHTTNTHHPHTHISHAYTHKPHTSLAYQAHPLIVHSLLHSHSHHSHLLGRRAGGCTVNRPGGVRAGGAPTAHRHPASVAGSCRGALVSKQKASCGGARLAAGAGHGKDAREGGSWKPGPAPRSIEARRAKAGRARGSRIAGSGDRGIRGRGPGSD